MNSGNPSPQLGRRDWLKALSLGGLASLLPQAARAAADPFHKADRVRGIVFLVSDGMSPGVLTMAEAFSQQTRQRHSRWWNLLRDPKSHHGLMDTASANSLVTDSAAASSAWGSGHRVHNGNINISPEGKALTPIAALLREKNCRCGLVTTATITHATPAGFAAQAPMRDDEESIAPQYLDRVDVLLGGGREFFYANKRSDGKDVVATYEKAGYQHLRDRSALATAKNPRLLGLFGTGHLPFAMDRKNHPTIPSLPEMADAALSRFLTQDQPFLLQIEGARIDHAAHLNDIAALLHEQLEFDATLEKVLSMTEAHPDVLVIVTSDHGNSNPGLNGIGIGYRDSSACFARIERSKESFSSLFGRWKQDPQQDLAAMIQKKLGFTLTANESSALRSILAEKPIVEWNHLLAKPEGLLGQFAGNHFGVGWTGTTHTSDPTIVTAIGPQSQRFSGLIRNTDVFRHFSEMLFD
jgi:alkaline phosphatase